MTAKPTVDNPPIRFWMQRFPLTHTLSPVTGARETGATIR